MGLCRSLTALIWLLICCPVRARSTPPYEGVNFSQDSSWQALLIRAKAENKYIFVDCYTTWAKFWDRTSKQAYSDAGVGAYFNEKFISIRIQMDSTAQDDEYLRHWHAVAHQLMTQYRIISYPGFLFFSPDGIVVHKQVGDKRADELMVMGANALDPRKQFYTLLRAYQQGKRDFPAMRIMADVGKDVGFGYSDTIQFIAKEYTDHYLLQPGANPFTKGNIEFILTFIRGSADSGFQFLYRNRKRIDKIMNHGISQGIIDFYIDKEEIWTRLYERGDPRAPVLSARVDWNAIYSAIVTKYSSEDAHRTVLAEEMTWYWSRKEWKDLVRVFVEKTDRYGIDTVGYGKENSNNLIWEILFEHATEKDDLEKGLRWMALVLKNGAPAAAWYDTYANLWYKLGRIQAALYWEKRAMATDPGNNGIQKNFEKMKKGAPTWGKG